MTENCFVVVVVFPRDVKKKKKKKKNIEEHSGMGMVVETKGKSVARRVPRRDKTTRLRTVFYVRKKTKKNTTYNKRREELR